MAAPKTSLVSVSSRLCVSVTTDTHLTNDHVFEPGTVVEVAAMPPSQAARSHSVTLPSFASTAVVPEFSVTASRAGSVLMALLSFSSLHESLVCIQYSFRSESIS